MQLHCIFWSNLAVLKQDVSLSLSLSLRNIAERFGTAVSFWAVVSWSSTLSIFGRLHPCFPCPRLKKSNNFSWWSSVLSIKLFTCLYYVIRVRLPNTNSRNFYRQKLIFSSIHWGGCGQPGSSIFSTFSWRHFFRMQMRMLKLCVSCWKMRNTGIKTRYPRPDPSCG